MTRVTSRLLLQKIDDRLAFCAMLADAQRQGLQPLQEQEGVEGAHRRAEIAQQGHARLDDIGDGSERLDGLGPDRAVIAGIGRIERGKRSACFSQSKLPPSTMAPPIEVPWPPMIFRGRIDDDGRAMVQRLAEHRRGGVVHDQRHAQVAADSGDLRDREDLQLGIGQGLGVIGAGAGRRWRGGNSPGSAGSTKRTSMP